MYRSHKYKMYRYVLIISVITFSNDKCGTDDCRVAYLSCI